MRRLIMMIMTLKDDDHHHRLQRGWRRVWPKYPPPSQRNQGSDKAQHCLDTSSSDHDDDDHDDNHDFIGHHHINCSPQHLDFMYLTLVVAWIFLYKPHKSHTHWSNYNFTTKEIQFLNFQNSIFEFSKFNFWILIRILWEGKHAPPISSYRSISNNPIYRFFIRWAWWPFPECVNIFIIFFYIFYFYFPSLSIYQ